MKILVVENDRKVNNEISSMLKDEEFNVFQSYDYENCILCLKNNPVDIVLLDLNCGSDGINTLKYIKDNFNSLIIVTSKTTDSNYILNTYDIGSIDYIRKPYISKEVLIKIKYLRDKSYNRYLIFSGLKIDLSARTIYVEDNKVSLTLKEYQLLTYLVSNNGIALSREQLLNNVWGYGFFGDDRTIDTHIKMLRKNLGKYKEYIQTVRGYGYKFNYNG